MLITRPIMVIFFAPQYIGLYFSPHTISNWCHCGCLIENFKHPSRTYCETHKKDKIVPLLSLWYGVFRCKFTHFRNKGNTTLKSPLDIESIYRKYTTKLSETSRAEMKKELTQEGKFYRASSSGMCVRKLYYESVLKLEPSKNYTDKTMRIFRLGDLIHQDLQNAMLDSVKDSKEKE